MGYFSDTLTNIKSKLGYVAPLLEVAGSATNAAKNWLGNEQGVAKVDATLRYWEAHTPSSTPIVGGPCNGIWVTTDDATVTGTSADGWTGTTMALPNKQWIEMSFTKITAVSDGNVYIGWYHKPSA